MKILFRKKQHSLAHKQLLCSLCLMVIAIGGLVTPHHQLILPNLMTWWKQSRGESGSLRATHVVSKIEPHVDKHDVKTPNAQHVTEELRKQRESLKKQYEEQRIVFQQQSAHIRQQQLRIERQHYASENETDRVEQLLEDYEKLIKESGELRTKIEEEEAFRTVNDVQVKDSDSILKQVQAIDSALRYEVHSLELKIQTQQRLIENQRIHLTQQQLELRQQSQVLEYELSKVEIQLLAKIADLKLEVRLQREELEDMVWSQLPL